MKCSTRLHVSVLLIYRCKLLQFGVLCKRHTHTNTHIRVIHNFTLWMNMGNWTLSGSVLALTNQISSSTHQKSTKTIFQEMFDNCSWITNYDLFLYWPWFYFLYMKQISCSHSVLGSHFQGLSGFLKPGGGGTFIASRSPDHHHISTHLQVYKVQLVHPLSAGLFL